jgi:hypothetical protein
MRSLLALTLLVACTKATGDDVDETPAFEITSSDITLAPGEETTRCFYFHTTNTSELQIYKWISDMAPGSHHMIVFSSLGTQPADGTVDNCDGANVPIPIYGTQIPHEELVFPDDDGMGNPLAQVITPGTAGFFQMHYLNTSDAPLVVNVKLAAYALPPNTQFTRTEIFATYNNDIAIPPHATNYTVSATCDSVDKKFWSLSSHSHKQSIATVVSDGGSTVFASTDWEHPGSKRWDAPTFFHFDTYQVTWSCTYNNTGDNANNYVYAGQSAATDEMCMATGYFFPATGPRGCIIDSGQCQCFL